MKANRVAFFTTIQYSTALFMLAFFMFASCSYNSVYASITHPVAIDRRIKTLVYGENEIMELTFKFGNFSIMKLEQDEDLIAMAFGNPDPWAVKVINKRLYIKPLEPSIRTNLFISTSKRDYMLDISSTEDIEDELDDKSSWLVSFFYPEKKPDAPKKYSVRAPNVEMPLSPTGNSWGKEVEDPLFGAVNFMYSFAGTGTAILPIQMFDDGKQTFFKFLENNKIVPSIFEVNLKTGRERRLRVSLQGEYVVIPIISEQLTLRYREELVCIFNEPMLKTIGDEVVYSDDGPEANDYFSK